MKNDKETLNDIYEKYEYYQNKNNLFFETNCYKKTSPNFVRTIISTVIVCILAAGIVYASLTIYNKQHKQAEMTPIFTGQLSSMNKNKIWVGTFQLVWNDLMELVGGKVEFVEGESELANELNKQSFTKDQLSEDSYYKIYGETTIELKEKIEKEILEKFNEKSNIIDKVDWETKNPGHVLYAMLKKKFTYLERFPTLPDRKFANSDVYIKYFGIDGTTLDTAKKNIEVLFYNSKEDFAVKLKTKEKEEVLLYRTSENNKSFSEIYDEMVKKSREYTGNKKFENKDEIRIPYIKVQEEINYDELCGKTIKGLDGEYIRLALQTVDFELNNVGGSVVSEALIETTKACETDVNRNFSFTDEFILFLKEEEKEKPYFALKVDDDDVLVKSEKQDYVKISENTTVTTKVELP